MEQKKKRLRDLIRLNINRIVNHDESPEYQVGDDRITFRPEIFNGAITLWLFVNGCRQNLSWQIVSTPHTGHLRNGGDVRTQNFYWVVVNGKRARYLYFDVESKVISSGTDLFKNLYQAYGDYHGRNRFDALSFKAQMKEMSEQLWHRPQHEIKKFYREYNALLRKSRLDSR